MDVNHGKVIERTRQGARVKLHCPREWSHHTTRATMLDVAGSDLSSRRRLRGAAWVLWIAVALIALQLTGAVHVLADAIFSDEPCLASMSGGCSDEAAGMDCPPGCPSCHCAHGGVGSLPSRASSELLPIADDASQTLALTDPRSPKTSSYHAFVFRPPRSVRSST